MEAAKFGHDFGRGTEFRPWCSNCVAQDGQQQKPEIQLKADNPPKVRNALEEWVAAAEKLNPDPLGIAEAPPWVEKALAEVVKTVLPGRKLPVPGEWDMELIAEFLGRTEAIGRAFNGEISSAPDLKKSLALIANQLGSQTDTPVMLKQEMAHDFRANLEAIQQGIPVFMKGALDSSHTDALKFNQGLSDGMELDPAEMTDGQIMQRHTKTFLTLALQWRRFSECESVAEIHRILCKELGGLTVESLKTFEERVAKKIGLKVRESGRPPGT
jgi:hypothetical protein